MLTTRAPGVRFRYGSARWQPLIEVHVDDRVVARELDLLEVVARGDAGVVEQHVEPAAREVDELAERARERGGVRDVEAPGPRVALAELARERLRAGLVHVVEPHEPAVAREQLRARAADAGGGAGDEDAGSVGHGRA
jgi:hypothetical protein